MWLLLYIAGGLMVFLGLVAIMGGDVGIMVQIASIIMIVGGFIVVGLGAIARAIANRGN